MHDRPCQSGANRAGELGSGQKIHQNGRVEYDSGFGVRGGHCSSSSSERAASSAAIAVMLPFTFLIFPGSFKQFDEYLDMVALAEKLVKQHGYEGIYQLASFHPLYLFADSSPDDPANYTNRSVYPMLHLLREESIDKALAHYDKPENIPVRNISFAREKGLVYMKMLRDACLKI